MLLLQDKKYVKLVRSILLIFILILNSILHSTFLLQLGNETFDKAIIDNNFLKGLYSNNFNADNPQIDVLSSTEFDITTTGEYYDGYNLFVVDRYNTIARIHDVYLVVIDMEGEIISSVALGSSPFQVYSIAKFINSSSIIVSGVINPFLWNFFEKTTYALPFNSHHDIEYVSETNTFLTLAKENVLIGGISYVFDKIEEYSITGEKIWSLSTQSFVSYHDWCPYQDLLGASRSITHSNSLFYNPNEDTILLNCRNLNTIYKINHTSKELIWSLGEHGEFDLFDLKGFQKESLWYHAHAFEYFDDNEIILFDNDYHNQTDIHSRISRIVEIKINEINRTAHEVWTYEAPAEYSSSIWGDADKLPNGNRLGTFGSVAHTADSYNAKLLEINEEKEIVWKLDFVEDDLYTYGIYRAERFTPHPGIEEKDTIYTNSIEDTIILLKTWSGYRTRSDTEGYYSLYLNGTLIDEGTHTFRSYWRTCLLDINLGKLTKGYYNLTIVLEDEEGNAKVEIIDIDVRSFYVIRTGFTEIELGQPNSTLKWEGKAESPLQLNLTIDDSLFNTTSWFSTNLSIDLNTLELGEHRIEFLLFNFTELVYNETFIVYIYPLETPEVYPLFSELEVTWGENEYVTWDIFDNTPKKWEIWINGSLHLIQDWSNKTYQLEWKIPKLDEGYYNVTLNLFDNAGLTSTSNILLTILPPSPPVIIYIPSEQEYQFGIENISISWSIHGGDTWTIFVDGVFYSQGDLTNDLFTFQTDDWDVSIWGPGQHNVTLEITDGSSKQATSSVEIVIWLNIADPYADSIVMVLSELFTEGDNALGEPDNEFCQIFEGYTLGYITLDMGEQEEILNQNGDDFQIYASGGEYQVWVGNEIEVPFTFLGSASGNASFNLDSISLNKIRYVKIQYTQGVFVNIDSIEAFYFNIPKWDSDSPIIDQLHDFAVYKNESFVTLTWVAFDNNPHNYSVSADNSLIQTGDWNGSLIICNIPLTKIGEILVVLILFDAFGNYAESSVIITVLGVSNISLILNITLPSIIAISGVAIFSIRNRKLKRR